MNISVPVEELKAVKAEILVICKENAQLRGELLVCKDALAVAVIMLSGETGQSVEEVEGRIRDRIQCAKEHAEREGLTE